jgi:MarR family transcriptional regulator for hemolysin
MIDQSTTFQKDLPLTLPLNMLTKQYVGVMFRKLAHVGIEKYYTAMLIIGKAGGNLTQQKLAGELHIDKATVVRMVDYLVERDFICRQQNPDDRREYFLVLTPKACQAIGEISHTIRQLNEMIFSDFSEEEKAFFWKAISRINETLSALPADEVLFHYDPHKNPVPAGNFWDSGHGRKTSDSNHKSDQP